MPLRDTSDKVIIQDGRSDPAAHSFEEFRLADAGFCLATRSEPDEATRETSLGRGFAVLTVNIAQLVAKKEVLILTVNIARVSLKKDYFRRHVDCWQLLEKVLLPLSPVLLIFASGCSGAVCVNPLFAQLHPDLLHLPATVKSLRAMRLKNLFSLLPTGCFKGNNLATVFMLFLGMEGRLACVCALASRPITDPRHRSPRPHMRFDSQVRVHEEDETSLPQKIPPSFSLSQYGLERPHTLDRCPRSTSVARTVFLPGLE